MLIPPPKVQQETLDRLQTHAKKYVKKKGIKEIRGKFQGNHLFLQVVKEEKGGLAGKLFKMGSVLGIGRLARLDYLGPNKWRFLIYKHDIKKYGQFPHFDKGTVEECLDEAASIYLV